MDRFVVKRARPSIDSGEMPSMAPQGGSETLQRESQAPDSREEVGEPRPTNRDKQVQQDTQGHTLRIIIFQPFQLDNRIALLKILSSLRYLVTRGPAVHSHIKSSNVVALLELRCEDSPILKRWLQHSSSKWYSDEACNEMLEIMSRDVTLSLVSRIAQAEHYSIMLDKSCDISNQEQVSVCFRIVTECLEVEELFLGFYSATNTESETIFSIIQDVLCRFHLAVSDCRGLYFDGAQNLAIFNEVVDMMTIECNTTRFQSKAIDIMAKAEKFLIGAETEFHELRDHFKDYVDEGQLVLHKKMFLDILKRSNETVDSVASIIDVFYRNPKFKSLLPDFLPELLKFLRLLLTIPVSTFARSSSSLERLKNYLSATIREKRLSHLAILYVHNEMTDSVCLESVADTFISRAEIRKATFAGRA